MTRTLISVLKAFPALFVLLFCLGSPAFSQNPIAGPGSSSVNYDAPGYRDNQGLLKLGEILSSTQPNLGIGHWTLNNFNKALDALDASMDEINKKDGAKWQIHAGGGYISIFPVEIATNFFRPQYIFSDRKIHYIFGINFTNYSSVISSSVVFRPLTSSSFFGSETNFYQLNKYRFGGVSLSYSRKILNTNVNHFAGFSLLLYQLKEEDFRAVGHEALVYSITPSLFYSYGINLTDRFSIKIEPAIMFPFYKYEGKFSFREMEGHGVMLNFQCFSKLVLTLKK